MSLAAIPIVALFWFLFFDATDPASPWWICLIDTIEAVISFFIARNWIRLVERFQRANEKRHSRVR